MLYLYIHTTQNKPRILSYAIGTKVLYLYTHTTQNKPRILSYETGTNVLYLYIHTLLKIISGRFLRS